MLFARCLQTHPFWLSTLGHFITAMPPLEGLPDGLQQQIRFGHEAMGANNYQTAAEHFAQASLALQNGDTAITSVVRFNEAICLVILGDLEQGHALMRIVVSNQPGEAQFLYGLGLVEIKRGNIEEAVGLFIRTVSLDQDFGLAWGALAIIYALCRMDAETENAARRARALNVSIRNNLVGLALMQATFSQGKPVEGACDFTSLAEEAEARMDDLLAQFPPVDRAALTHPPHGLPVLFISCDHVYAFEHALPLIWSVAESGSRCAIHLHVVNPGRGFREAIDKVSAEIAPMLLFTSQESVFIEQYSGPNVYYSCVRFARLYQFYRANHAPVLMLDADVLVRGKLDEVAGFGVAGLDVGLIHMPMEPVWQEIAANLSFFNPTPLAQRFLAQVAVFILDNILKGTALWFLDQIALYACYQKRPSAMTVKLLPPEKNADLKHSPDALVWIVTTAKKADDDYNRFKRDLRERHEFDQLLPADAPAAQIVNASYGKMLIDPRDIYIGRSIQYQGIWCGHEIELLRPLIKPGHTVVDAGANIGSHTLPFSNFVGPHGRVYAFEPQRFLFQMLAANLALNNIGNVYGFAKGLSSQPSMMKAGRPLEANNFGAVRLHEANQGVAGEAVEVISLDSLRLDACHLIKMDIEGMEVEALQGAVETIRRHQPILYLENNPGARRRPLIDAVRALGYRIYWHGLNTSNPNMLCLAPRSRLQLQGLDEEV